MMYLKTLTTKPTEEDQQEARFDLTIENYMRERESVEKGDSPTHEEEGHAGLDKSTNLRGFEHLLPEKI